MNLFDLMSRMTLFPWLVILLLAAMNVLTLTVAAIKWWQLRRMRRANRLLSPAFGRALEDDRIDDAIALTREHAAAPLGRVLGEALRRVAPLVADPAYAPREIAESSREQLIPGSRSVPGSGVCRATTPLPWISTERP